MRVALFGTGWIMKFHARAVLEHPGAELVAAANWREESLAALAKEFSIPRTTTRWEDLAEDPDVDAVVVGTPNALHAPQAIACLRAGKHVLVEKPMAATLAEAEEMAAAAARGRAFLMVAHCWRFHDDVRRMRDRIAAGEFGRGGEDARIRRAREVGPVGLVHRPGAGRAAARCWTWASTRSTRRGSCWATRSPPASCAVVGRRYGDYEVDDDGILLITWDDGTNSIVESGWWQPHLAGLEADTEVYGTGGYDRIWHFTEGPPGYEHCAQPMYSAQMAAFLDAVVAGRAAAPERRGRPGRHARGRRGVPLGRRARLTGEGATRSRPRSGLGRPQRRPFRIRGWPRSHQDPQMGNRFKDQDSIKSRPGTDEAEGDLTDVEAARAPRSAAPFARERAARPPSRRSRWAR